AQLVPGASRRDHRCAAHARGRGAAADAGEHRPCCRPRAQRPFRALVGTSSMPALDRLKLYKLVWDLIGSEFAGRHMLYERFYAGNSIIVRNQSDREAPWETFHATVEVCWNACRRPNRRDSSSDGRCLCADCRGAQRRCRHFLTAAPGLPSSDNSSSTVSKSLASRKLR